MDYFSIEHILVELKDWSLDMQSEVYLQSNVDRGQWANRVSDPHLRTPFDHKTHIKTALHLLAGQNQSGRETRAHLSQGVQVASAASAQTVTLADSEQRGRQNGAKVIEGPPSHSLRFLRDALGLRRVFGKQLGQHRLVCVAVAAEGASHSKEGGDGVPAQVD